jgi:hypothetical protein
MSISTKSVLAGAGLVLGLSLVAAEAPAAVLVLDSVQRIASPDTPVDLTAAGPADWAYWSQTASGLTPPVAPVNRKSGGAAISSLTNVGGTTLRGSTTATSTLRYNWTDGTSPATGTNADLRGLVFNSTIGTDANGKGMSFTITGDTAAERGVQLYLGGFAVTGNLSLTLNGATTVVDSSQVFANTSPKQMAIYTVRFRPDSPSDVLTVQWTASAITDVSFAHVGIQAVAVAVPEPGFVGLGLVGVAGVLGRRRRG